MKKFTFVLALVALCFINGIAQQTPSDKLFDIKGLVKNQEGISLAGLTLYFEGDQSKIIAITDETGSFAVKLPVGKYKARTNAEVSEKFLAFIEISDNRLNPNNFELLVEMNVSCCSQMSNGSNAEVIKYVSPPFPAAARAVRAGGEVIVFVKIDSEGKVTSAKAERGHPLLRAASKQAARQWLFSTDRNGAERDGKIIFAFVLPKKETQNLFIKPNRLVVFASVVIIDSISTH